MCLSRGSTFAQGNIVPTTAPNVPIMKALFPLEATSRMEPGGQERLSLKVDKIEQKKIDHDALFKVPESYYEINAQPF